ncbi:MAG: hypothetical protein WBG50_15855, partial [Desulfomonilaceae bacterium]
AYSSYEYTNQSRISSNIGCLAFKNRPRGKLGSKMGRGVEQQRDWKNKVHTKRTGNGSCFQ